MANFAVDVANKASGRNRAWYQNYFTTVLESAKEKQAREIDTSIEMAKTLLGVLNEKRALPVDVPPMKLEQQADINMMKPISPEILNILYGSTEKGSSERYFKARNKYSPEDKYYNRYVTSWDYGWQQKKSKMPRGKLYGRCAILRDTFYRKNNIGPNPPHYSEPGTGQFSVCSQYSCNFN